MSLVLARGEAVRMRVPLAFRNTAGVGFFTTLRLFWGPADPKSLEPKLDLAWAQVAKHMVSPAGKVPIRLRLDLTTNSPPLVFEFIDGVKGAREAQQEARALITELLHPQMTAQRAPSARTASAGHVGKGKGKAKAAPGDDGLKGTTQWGRGRRGVLATGSGGESLRASAVDANNIMGNAKTRAALLAGDASLRQQYKEMVEGGLISAEDFWDSRHGMLAEEQAKSRGQTPGASSTLESEIEPIMSAKDNKLRYVLTANAIHQIFVMYPAVERAYQATVPTEMSEGQFWVKFFQSAYLHGNKSVGVSAGGAGDGGASGASASMASGADDMFARYAALEEEAARAAEAGKGGGGSGGGGAGAAGKRKAANTLPAGHQVDPMVDLTEQFGDYHVREADARTPEEASKEQAALKVIKRFNRHAALVMDPPAKHNARAHAKPPVIDTPQAATDMPELKETAPPLLVPLTLRDAARYTDSSASDSLTAAAASAAADAVGGFVSAASRASASVAASVPSLSLELATQALRGDFLLVIRDPLVLDPKSLASQKAGEDVMKQLNRVGAREAQRAVDPSAYPGGYINQVNRQLQIMGELLRHFYGALAAATPPLDKLGRLMRRMEQQYDEIETMRNALPKDTEGQRRSALLKPLMDCLNHAFEQHRRWEDGGGGRANGGAITGKRDRNGVVLAH